MGVQGTGRPRVVVDGRWIGRAGLGRYVDGLLGAMVQLDHGLELVVLAPSSIEEPEWAAADHLRLVDADVPWFGVEEQVRLPRLINRLRPDLTHFTNFNVPLAHRAPFVVTVHDLTLIDHPTVLRRSVGHRIRSKVMERVLTRAVRNAEEVLVPSEFVAGELRRRLGADRVLVSPEAPGELPPPAPDALHDLDLEPGYLLYVGKSYPHKNLGNLLEAISRLRDTWPEVRLVAVGPEDAHRAAFRSDVECRGLNHAVRLLSDVSDSELAAIYGGAQIFVLPSLSEGFGLPGLEAMKAGIPVASSDRTCLPEVYGDAAVYFDASDPADIARTLLALQGDSVARVRLADGGRSRAARYSWQRTAEVTLEAYLRSVSSAV